MMERERGSTERPGNGFFLGITKLFTFAAHHPLFGNWHELNRRNLGQHLHRTFSSRALSLMTVLQQLQKLPMSAHFCTQLHKNQIFQTQKHKAAASVYPRCSMWKTTPVPLNAVRS